MKWRGATEINKSFSHGLCWKRGVKDEERRPTQSWGKERKDREREREYEKQ
jgi:hypothetical protein